MSRGRSGSRSTRSGSRSARSGSRSISATLDPTSQAPASTQATDLTEPFIWEAAQFELFMEQLAQISKEGGLNRNITHWLKKALTRVGNSLEEKWPGVDWSYPRLRNKWRNSKARYKDWLDMFQKTGVVFDPDTGLFVAGNETWISFLSSHPGASWLRSRPLPHREYHAEVFTIDWATGEYIVTPTERLERLAKDRGLVDRAQAQAEEAAARHGDGSLRGSRRPASASPLSDGSSDGGSGTAAPRIKKRRCLTAAASTAQLAETISAVSAQMVTVLEKSAQMDASPQENINLERCMDILVEQEPWKGLRSDQKDTMVRSLDGNPRWAAIFAARPERREFVARILLSEAPVFEEESVQSDAEAA